MQRPDSVPEGATFNEDDNEWVLGESDEHGEFHGDVRYWREDGTLCNRCDFVHGSPTGFYERFHESGELSQAGVLNQGQLVMATHFRTEGYTTEELPAGAPPQMWVMQMFFEGGRPTGARGFDKEGDPVITPGMPQPPEGVPQDAIFISGVWRHGDSDEGHRPLGTWREWNEEGRLCAHITYEKGLISEVIAVEVPRPENVSLDAVFNVEQDIWFKEARTNRKGELEGERRVWRADGVLIAVEDYEQDVMVRERMFHGEGALASDCTSTLLGLPKRRWFSRTDESTFHNFPNVRDEHPDARIVEYRFDEHGFMTRFTIKGEAGEDDLGILEDEEVYRGPGGMGGDQKRFGSPEQASLPWRRAGDEYTTSLNKWLAKLYSGAESLDEEPTFSSPELQRAYIEGVVALNARGESAAKHFPTYHDAIHSFFWDSYGESVSKVLHAGNAQYVRVDDMHGPTVYQITAKSISKEESVFAFGASADKKHIAFAMEDALVIVDQSDGAITQLAYPRHYGAMLPATRLEHPSTMKITEIVVVADGKEALLASAEGIFHLRQAGSERLYPLGDELAEYQQEFDASGEEEFGLDIERATVSANAEGTLAACGGYFHRGIFAPHAIFERKGERYLLKASSKEDAFFPGPTTFHKRHPTLSFSATLYASLNNQMANTTFRLDLADLPSGTIEEFSGGVWQGQAVVNCSVSFRDGFLLGLSNGYIYYMSATENAEQLGYVHLGGSIECLDTDPSENEVFAATSSGSMVRLRFGEKESRNLISDLKIEDAGRIMFWRSFEPLRG